MQPSEKLEIAGTLRLLKGAAGTEASRNGGRKKDRRTRSRERRRRRKRRRSSSSSRSGSEDSAISDFRGAPSRDGTHPTLGMASGQDGSSLKGAQEKEADEGLGADGDEEESACRTPSDRASWEEVCLKFTQEAQDMCDLAENLLKLVKLLPKQFVNVFGQVAGQHWDKSFDGPTARTRQRDLFPLPLGEVSEEDLPLRGPSSGTGSGRRRGRQAWLVLVVVALNWTYFGSSASGRMPAFNGPPTKVQGAALMFSGVSCDRVVLRKARQEVSASAGAVRGC